MDKDVINRTIAEKLFGLKYGVDFGEFGDHEWKLDEDGDVDIWVLDIEFHNGPGCVKCKYSYCMHCGDPTKKCSIAVPDYFTQRGCDLILKKFTENGYTVRATLRNNHVNVAISKFTTALSECEGETLVEAVVLAAYEYLLLLK